MEGSQQGHIPGLEAKARGSDYKPESSLMVFPRSLGKIPLPTVWSVAMRGTAAVEAGTSWEAAVIMWPMVVAGRERGVKETSSKHTGT